MSLAQGHNAVPQVKLKPATPRSRDKLSTTEPLCSREALLYMFFSKVFCFHCHPGNAMMD